MGPILPIISIIIESVLAGVVAWLVKKVTTDIDKRKADDCARREEQAKQNKMQKDALLAILRDRLFQACFTVLDQHGEITPTDRENIESLHEQYRALGGNHTGDDLTKRALSLKIVREYEKNEADG